MRIQPANELSPITVVRDACVWPLARRVARWSAWAWKMARRFGPRRQHAPFLGRILLQRAGTAYGRGSVNHHWHLDWRPTFRWYHPSVVWRDNLSHKRHAEAKETQSGFAWGYQSPRRDADRGGYRRNALASYLHSRAAYGRYEWVPGGARAERQVRQQDAMPSQGRTTLSRQSIPRWHRVEARPDQARMARRELLALQAREGLPRVNVNRPTWRVFRQRTTLVEAEPARARQPQVPTASASLPFGGAPQQLDLNKLTDQVMQQIDRRLVIWRERTGRV
jgi:hypothetical protein